MGIRRRLDSVAYGVSHAFVARDNDVDGWWALGLILAGFPPGDPDLRIDLLTGEAIPEPEADNLHALGPAWSSYLFWSIERHGVPRSAVRSATLDVSFDRTVGIQSHIPDLAVRDHPFRCVVAIGDDRGLVHTSQIEGQCARPTDFQDPNPYRRPLRSTSRDAGRMADRIGSPPNDAAEAEQGVV